MTTALVHLAYLWASERLALALIRLARAKIQPPDRAVEVRRIREPRAVRCEQIRRAVVDLGRVVLEFIRSEFSCGRNGSPRTYGQSVVKRSKQYDVGQRSSHEMSAKEELGGSISSVSFPIRFKTNRSPGEVETVLEPVELQSKVGRSS